MRAHFSTTLPVENRSRSKPCPAWIRFPGFRRKDAPASAASLQIWRGERSRRVAGGGGGYRRSATDDRPCCQKGLEFKALHLPVLATGVFPLRLWAQRDSVGRKSTASPALKAIGGLLPRSPDGPPTWTR